MYTTATAGQQDIQPSRVKRKPPPATPIQQVPSLQQQPQYSSHPLHKLSFSERYPDPDPTDPFAPLWVLRNRTSSALHRETPPAISLLQRGPSVQDDINCQHDIRRSVSNLHTLILDPQLYISAHGRSVPAKASPTCSADNANTNIPSVRRHSFKPLSLSSASRGSIDLKAINLNHAGIAQQSYPENDSSGAESDATRVHQSRSETDPAPLRTMRRQRAGSTNNRLARFLKPRNANALRASIMDIDRIRKASISPPVFSTVVWASQGQDFVPIKSHPLHQNAISILTNASVPDVAPPRSETPRIKQATPLVVSPVPIKKTSSIQPLIGSLNPTPTTDYDVHITDLTTSPAPPRSPPLTSRSCQTPHTDETHSTFSFVHVPPATPARMEADFVHRPPPNQPITAATPTLHSALIPASASMPTPLPTVAATITSSATTKIRRTTSRSASKHTTSPEQVKPKGEWVLPSLAEIMKAASLPIIAESGVRLSFGALFAHQRVIVIFVRHFWCPLCQDYISSVTSLARHVPEILGGMGVRIDGDDEKGGIKATSGASVGGITAGGGEASGHARLVVISNGSYTMIGKYKQIFGLELDVYTDPSLAVYAALGMRKDPASLPQQTHLHEPHKQIGHGHGKSRDGQAYLHAHDLGGGKHDLGREKGSCGDGGYVKHGLMGGIAMVFVRALKVGMPVWEKGGDLNQLGGEFVFGPGMACTYAHRMQTAKGHAPFDDVLYAAGVLPPVSPLPQVRPPRENANREKGQDKKSSNMEPSKSRGQHTRARGQTIDVESIAQRSSAENKRSHRRRQSVVRTASMGIGVSTNPKFDASSLAISGRHKRPLDSSVVTFGSESIPSMVISSDHIKRVNLPRKSLGDTPVSGATRSDDERWMQERHRSLQRLKEKKNARRGLANEYRKQEPNHTPAVESSTPAPPSDNGGERQRGVATETTYVQHQTSGGKVQREDDDIVLLGREMRMSRVNLSRDFVNRREREKEQRNQSLLPAEATIEDTGAGMCRGVQVEDDAETSSDKTLVHQ